MRKLSLLSVVVAGVLAGASCAVSATLIDVDLQNSGGVVYGTVGSGAGAAATGAAGDKWNGVSVANTNPNSLSNVALFDSTGQATTATLSLTGNGSWNGSSGNGWGGLALNDLMRDFAFASAGQTLTVTVSGFAANTACDVYVYSNGNDGTGYPATLTVNDVSKAVTGSWSSTLIDGQSYAHFASTADAMGKLTITSYAAGNFSVINGLQISAVPEPTTVGILGLASLLALGCRRHSHA